MDQPKPTAFFEALRRLTPVLTTPADGEKPLVSERTLRYWRAGNLPPPLLILFRHPELLDALIADMELVAPSDAP